jgi:hypothetical protein
MNHLEIIRNNKNIELMSIPTAEKAQVIAP